MTRRNTVAAAWQRHTVPYGCTLMQILYKSGIWHCASSSVKTWNRWWDGWPSGTMYVCAAVRGCIDPLPRKGCPMVDDHTENGWLTGGREMHRNVCSIERTQTEHIRLKRRKTCLKKRIPGMVWLQGRPGLYALAKQTAIRIDLSDGKNYNPMKREKGPFKKIK